MQGLFDLESLVAGANELDALRQVHVLAKLESPFQRVRTDPDLEAGAVQGDGEIDGGGGFGGDGHSCSGLCNISGITLKLSKS